jgi:LCP family protein required for cell wall assembly
MIFMKKREATGHRARKVKKQKRASRFTRRQRVFNTVTIIFLSAVIVASGVYIGLDSALDARFMQNDPKASYRSIEHTNAKTNENLDVLIPAEGIFASEFKDSKRVNILLLGNTDEQLSDTIMLASFDPDTQRLDIISVPRDTYYEREGYSASFLKMNAVFHEGWYATAEAVHDVLQGIPINYYAVIDYKGIKKIVDAMDGVPMDVKQTMHYTSRRQNLYISIEKGEQVLDGDHAVQFLRYRKGYASGDVGRVEAQQQFLKNAAKKALKSNIAKVAKSIVDNVDSDVTLRAMLYVSSNVSGMSENSIRSFVTPGDYANIGGLSFWVRKPDADIQSMLRLVYNGEETVTDGAVQESSYYPEQTKSE